MPFEVPTIAEALAAGQIAPDVKETPVVRLSDEEFVARNSRWDDASSRMIRSARRADAKLRWLDFWPANLRETNWEDARLAPWRPQIDRIHNYELGAKGLIASGPTGRGKTRAMCALMHRLGTSEGCDVRYWTANEWFATLQGYLQYGRDDAKGWVEATARRHVVLIDDYGQEAVTSTREGWAQAWFFRFLDIRVAERLPLFITTNLTATQMADRNGSIRGDPLMRRLLEVADPVSFR